MIEGNRRIGASVNKTVEIADYSNRSTDTADVTVYNNDAEKTISVDVKKVPNKLKINDKEFDGSEEISVQIPKTDVDKRASDLEANLEKEANIREIKNIEIISELRNEIARATKREEYLYSLIKPTLVADKVVIGDIYTGRESGIEPDARALATAKGKIIYVGDESGVQEYIESGYTQVYKCEDGELVTPGLIDAHTHVSLLTMSKFSEMHELPKKEHITKEEYLEYIEDYIKKHPEPEKDNCYMFHGWEDAAFEQPTGPEYSDLDKITKTAKIYTLSGDGHSIWVNSTLMREAGIPPEDRDTKDPTGGRIWRYETGEKKGLPTGCFKDTAMYFIDREHRPQFSDEVHQAGILYAGPLFNDKNGYVAKFHAGDNDAAKLDRVPLITNWIKLDKEHRLPSYSQGSFVINDVNVYGEKEDRDALLKQVIKFRDETRGTDYEMNVIKIYIDGVIENAGALLVEPYADNPENYGTTRWGHAGPKYEEETKEALIRLGHVIAEANKNGMQVHAHIMGDKAAKDFLDAVENAEKELNKAGLNGLEIIKNARNTMVHLALIEDIDMDRMYKYDIIACFNTWAWKEKGVWEEQVKLLGERRAWEQYPMQSLIKKYIKYSFGTDLGASFTYDSIECFHNLVTRRNKENDPETALKPDEKLTREQAINAMTKGAAYQMFKENDLGTLEVGKEASLDIFSENILNESLVPDDKIMQVFVKKCMIKGNW